MIEVGQILAGLVQRTTEGKLKWSRAVQSDRFVTSVDAISVVIMEIDAILGALDYRLEILDESGETVESLPIPGYEPWMKSSNYWHVSMCWPAVQPSTLT